MLEHVTVNQTRFVAPGLSADSRGIALGRFCVVLVPSMDRVVGLFRGLSERGSLDDWLPSLQILQLRTPLKSLEFLVKIPCNSTNVADTIASTAALIGGLVFTGSAKHFVKYRDAGAPLGYDVDALHAGGGNFILYAADFVQAYDTERELPFNMLVLNLSLEPDRLAVHQPNEPVLLRAVPGLWRVVTSYLRRNNLACEVAACEGRGPGSQDPEQFFLIRSQLQPRMLSLFRCTPGITVYQEKTKRVAVELGYSHPLELSSCASIFEDEKFYVFTGAQDRVEIIGGKIIFISGRALIRLGKPAESLEPRTFDALHNDGLDIPLKLVPASGPRPPVRASRIPLDQAEWLRKLVYLLPPQILARFEICLTADSIFLLSSTEAEFVPLGVLYYRAGPGVLVPVGYDLLPRVQPDVLAEHLEVGQNKLVFYSTESLAPQWLPRAAFGPLTRHALAPVQLEAAAGSVAPEQPEDKTVWVVNDPVKAFPLWGYDAGADGDGSED